MGSCVTNCSKQNMNFEDSKRPSRKSNRAKKEKEIEACMEQDDVAEETLY